MPDGSFKYPARAGDVSEAMLAMPIEELIRLSRYPLTVLPSKQALYENLAEMMASEIETRRRQGQWTRWILPIGPKSQYPILAKLTNERRISWENVWAFHMDEWLDWEGRPLPVDHPFSLRGYAERFLYNLIDPPLRPPPSQIIFPDPGDLDAFSGTIARAGGVDATFAGFGFRGHLAFNETPNNRWQRISEDDFAAGKTRIVRLLDDTIIAHSQRGTGGYTQGIPQMAITCGMADILRAETIYLLTDGGAWKQWMLRVFLLTTQRDSDYAITLCHGHPDVRVICDASSAAPIDPRFGRDPQQVAMGKPIVTVVGSFCVDILIRADRLPVWGETLIGRDFYLGPGGKGGNQAAGIARMGATTHFITAVGEDDFAQLAFDLARAEGIDPGGIQRIADATTSVGFGLLDPAGRSACITDLAALAAMDAAMIDRFEPLIAQSDVVLTMLENPLAAAARAMRLGRKHGKLTILNPAPATQLDDEVLLDCDIVTPNESELRVVLGLSPDDPTDDLVLARQLRRRGIKTLIVTQGERGALIVNESGEVHIPGIGVKAVDSTGAGDAFNAALAVALAEGSPLLRAVQLANAAGALACTKLGSIPALGRRAEIEALCSKHYGER